MHSRDVHSTSIDAVTTVPFAGHAAVMSPQQPSGSRCRQAAAAKLLLPPPPPCRAGAAALPPLPPSCHHCHRCLRQHPTLPPLATAVLLLPPCCRHHRMLPPPATAISLPPPPPAILLSRPKKRNPHAITNSGNIGDCPCVEDMDLLKSTEIQSLMASHKYSK